MAATVEAVLREVGMVEEMCKRHYDTEKELAQLFYDLEKDLRETSRRLALGNTTYCPEKENFRKLWKRQFSNLDFEIIQIEIQFLYEAWRDKGYVTEPVRGYTGLQRAVKRLLKIGTALQCVLLNPTAGSKHLENFRKYSRLEEFVEIQFPCDTESENDGGTGNEQSNANSSEAASDHYDSAEDYDSVEDHDTDVTAENVHADSTPRDVRNGIIINVTKMDHTRVDSNAVGVITANATITVGKSEGTGVPKRTSSPKKDITCVAKRANSPKINITGVTRKTNNPEKIVPPPPPPPPAGPSSTGPTADSRCASRGISTVQPEPPVVIDLTLDSSHASKVVAPVPQVITPAGPVRQILTPMGPVPAVEVTPVKEVVVSSPPPPNSSPNSSSPSTSSSDSSSDLPVVVSVSPTLVSSGTPSLASSGVSAESPSTTAVGTSNVKSTVSSSTPTTGISSATSSVIPDTASETGNVSSQPAGPSNANSSIPPLEKMFGIEDDDDTTGKDRDAKKPKLSFVPGKFPNKFVQLDNPKTHGKKDKKDKKDKAEKKEKKDKKEGNGDKKNKNGDKKEKKNAEIFKPQAAPRERNEPRNRNDRVHQNSRGLDGRVRHARVRDDRIREDRNRYDRHDRRGRPDSRSRARDSRRRDSRRRDSRSRLKRR